MSETHTTNLLTPTAQIVAAHVGKSQVPAKALPGSIRAVHTALAGTAGPVAAEPQRPEPAVPPKRSVFPDYIMCLQNRKKRKMLKRHLNCAYGMTPAQYRERWGLPSDYPMVAPNYAERWSAPVKTIGLGQKGGPGRTKAAEPAGQQVPAGKSGTRGRKKAAA